MNINVNRAINTAYGYLGETYSDHDTDEKRKYSLYLIKFPSQYGPSATFSINALAEGTNTGITKSPPQFACRYVFADNENPSGLPYPNYPIIMLRPPMDSLTVMK